MKLFFTIAIVVLTLCYPLAVYFGLQYLSPRYLALLLLTLGVARSLSAGNAGAASRWSLVAIIMLLAAWTWLAESDTALKLYPVIINLNLLIFFGWSLFAGTPVVEKLARLQDPQLPDHAIAYTRRVTQVWCGFFLLNGLIALATVLYGDDKTWTLYNGLIAYILMGTLMGGELLVRRRVKRINEAKAVQTETEGAKSGQVTHG